MKQFTLKLLGKIGLTFTSECNRLIAYKTNTIQQLKNNNTEAKSTINELNSKIVSLKQSLNEHRVTQQRMNKIKYVDKLSSNKLQKWSNEVRKVGKCDICSTTIDLSAHHLYDKFSHPTLAYNVDNGVCLCEHHHQDYHKTCKEDECTPKSYLKYKNSLYKGNTTFTNIMDNCEITKLSA